MWRLNFWVVSVWLTALIVSSCYHLQPPASCFEWIMKLIWSIFTSTQFQHIWSVCPAHCGLKGAQHPVHETLDPIQSPDPSVAVLCITLLPFGWFLIHILVTRGRCLTSFHSLSKPHFMYPSWICPEKKQMDPLTGGLVVYGEIWQENT